MQNTKAAKEERDNPPSEETTKEEYLVLGELGKKLVLNFSEIAYNNNDESKAGYNLIFDKIRDTIPRNPEDSLYNRCFKNFNSK